MLTLNATVVNSKAKVAFWTLFWGGLDGRGKFRNGLFFLSFFLSLDCSLISFVPLCLQLEKALTPETLLQWTNPSMMANTKVNVFLPKFSVEGDYDLKPLLESLGMTNVFNESASDFSEMCETKGVVLSKIIHKVSLEVNEQGGESREVPGYRILQHKDEFKADHPFIFLFRHNKTRNVILSGRFCSP